MYLVICVISPLYCKRKLAQHLIFFFSREKILTRSRSLKVARANLIIKDLDVDTFTIKTELMLFCFSQFHARLDAVSHAFPLLRKVHCFFPRLL